MTVRYIIRQKTRQRPAYVCTIKNYSMKNFRLIPAIVNSGTCLPVKANVARKIIFSIFLIISGFQLVSVPMIRLKMNGLVNSLDETVIYYQAGATAGFDASYDSYFLPGPNPAPHISQQCNSVLMAINGIAPVSQTFSMSIKATTHMTGNFTITAVDFEELPAGTCASLIDLATGNTVNILANPYSFLLQDTTSAPRLCWSSLTIRRHSLPP